MHMLLYRANMIFTIIFPNICIILLLPITAGVSSVAESNHVVETKQGRIVGTRFDFETDDMDNVPGLQKPVHAYLGIPYAQPPVGNLRFKPPIANIWSGQLNATRLGNRCPQLYSPAFPVLGNYDEDCLNLDVYVPIPVPNKAAVMFWIHGGAFVIGAGSMEILPPSTLAAIGDVIVVAANYRLGALGFLSTGDEEAPGNMGLLDQRAAMKWVRDNIEAFGGDPNRVTIFGESAGAASVSCHTLSPLSKGLFSGAIMQSGVALSPWAVNTNRTNNVKRAFSFGEMVGCTNISTALLVQCLRSVSVADLVNVTAMISDRFDVNDDAILPFTPVIDGYFLPNAPATLLAEGSFNKVNIMAGHTSHEAMLLVMSALKDPREPHINATLFETFLTISKIGRLVLHPIQRQAMDLVYLDGIIKDSCYLDTFIRLSGDLLYICPTDTFIRAFESTGIQTYLYHMTHHPSTSIFNTPWSGACHADDLVFMFGVHFHPESPFNLTTEEAQMSVQTIKFWSNFAKTGDPKPILVCSISNKSTLSGFSVEARHGKLFMTLDYNPNLESAEIEVAPNESSWPEFTSLEPAYKELSLQMTNGRALKAKECRFWNEYLPKLNALLDGPLILRKLEEPNDPHRTPKEEL